MGWQPAAAAAHITVGGATRVLSLLGRSEDLAKFCLVGAIGYAVNLALYTALLHGGLHYLSAAVASFSLAVINNYTWNRLWTFRSRRAGIYDQGVRFLIVSLFSLGANLLILHALVGFGSGKLAAQALAIVLVTPLNFLGSKLWAFGGLRPITAR